MTPSTLQGIGPWNVTLQLVGRQNSELVSFSGIETARRRLQVGLPKDVNREGGSVEINIGGYYFPTPDAILT
jgi:nucleoporin POM152